MAKLIALSDGHGMETPGKRTPIFSDNTKSPDTGKNFMHENEFNRAVVKKLAVHLKRCGFETLEVAQGDTDVSLTSRVKLANDRKADAYVSIHANAHLSAWGSANGVETFHHANSSNGKKLATIVQKHLSGGTKQSNRGVKTADFYELRATNMVAILVEAGFMDNLREAKLLLSDAFREECAIEVTKGICEYYGVVYVSGSAPGAPNTSTVTSKPSTGDKLFRVQVGAFKDKNNAQALSNELKAKGYSNFIVEN